VRFVDGDGIAPVQAIRRAADRDISDERTALQAGEWQGRNHPDAVFGVICHRRVRRRAIVAVLVIHSQAGEIAIVPGLSAIGRGGKTDIAAAPPDASGTTGNVERGHNGVAPGEHRWLHFGFMIAVRIGEIVDADAHRAILGSGKHGKRQPKGQHSGQSQESASTRQS
jgi:hypothetical protein